MPEQPVQHIVILGGGSAGWLTAGVIAAEHSSGSHGGTSAFKIKITLIESPNVAPIGVGEGTWPTMRATLKKIGVSETEFFRECDASFKQGAKFAQWVTGQNNDFYYHPLMLPMGFQKLELVKLWQQQNEVSFSDFVCLQEALCERGLAPKHIRTPEFEGVANYAYHLSSEKFGDFLKKHCKEKLDVQHIVDHVVGVQSAEDGDIAALETEANGRLQGDLFVDCSGVASLLLGKHYQIPFLEKKHILFNDRALAVQVPNPREDSPIASHTISTAHTAGWIWDIGLPTRRGVGSVYSSAHMTDDEAHHHLTTYLAESVGEGALENLAFRKINVNPGHRQIFWHRNCVAVGMAAGFLEPLEASALVLVETSAAMISANLPPNRDVMDIVARQFNQRFDYYWETIIDFLKMHYALTKRTDSDYWIDHVNPASIPTRLQERLQLWRYREPNKYDFPWADEMFPAASWQYVLYGMGFDTDYRDFTSAKGSMNFNDYSQLVKNSRDKCLSQLPDNRDLINKIHQYGMQKI